MEKIAIEKLHHCGLSITRPRIEILKYLMTHHVHPSVDDIYQEMLSINPGLSRTTVYNTVKCLSDNGLVTMLTIDGHNINVDENTTPHAHLLCRNCGRIVDLPLKGITMQKASNGFLMDGNLIEQVHQYYLGVCQSCIEKAKNSEN